jgi:hypothetical protein
VAGDLIAVLIDHIEHDQHHIRMVIAIRFTVRDRQRWHDEHPQGDEHRQPGDQDLALHVFLP